MVITPYSYPAKEKGVRKTVSSSCLDTQYSPQRKRIIILKRGEQEPVCPQHIKSKTNTSTVTSAKSETKYISPAILFAMQPKELQSLYCESPKSFLANNRKKRKVKAIPRYLFYQCDKDLIAFIDKDKSILKLWNPKINTVLSSYSIPYVPKIFAMAPATITMAYIKSQKDNAKKNYTLILRNLLTAQEELYPLNPNIIPRDIALNKEKTCFILMSEEAIHILVKPKIYYQKFPV
jgi:hypothetical protein